MLAVVKVVLQPRELQELTIVMYGNVDAFSTSSLPDTALVFVVLILFLLS